MYSSDYFFFFSSRRRHTRWTGDWSSDVCSSDLAYREQAQSISFEDRQNIVVEKLKELSVKATEASSQRIVHETAWKQVQALGTNLNALLLLPAVASDPRISEIRANLGRQESEIATLKQRYLE